jgi:hypothetical protein
MPTPSQLAPVAPMTLSHGRALGQCFACSVVTIGVVIGDLKRP